MARENGLIGHPNGSPVLILQLTGLIHAYVEYTHVAMHPHVRGRLDQDIQVCMCQQGPLFGWPEPQVSEPKVVVRAA